MSKNFPRLLPVTAALALLLTACGGDDPSTQPIDAAVTTVAGGLRAPTPIKTTGGNAAAGADGRLAAPAAEASLDMIAPDYYVINDYVVGPNMPALPNNTTGYVFDGNSMPSADDAARVAAALGVSGEPTQIDDGYSVYWRVGPDDGTGPSVTVWDDAMLSWNYDFGWATQPSYGCAVAGTAVAVDPAVESVGAEPDQAPPADESFVEESAPVEEPMPVEPIEECVEPEPPANVPDQAGAEARASEFLAALGIDAATVSFETWAEDWSASTTASEMIDGVVARSWGFTFGGEGVLQYAWGSVAAPEAVGPYTLIDLDTAVARLNDGNYGYGYAAGRGIATDLAVDGVAVGAPEPMPVDIAEGDVPPDAPPVEEPVEPQHVTITLVDVQPDLWWVWDVDGSAWLLPAYRFIGDDGGWYTVPAVTDDFLIQVDPPVEPAPMPVDPPEVATMIEPQSLIGMSVDEAMKVAEGAGQTARVVAIDGEFQAVTDDFSDTRLNLAVETEPSGVQIVTDAVYDADLGTLAVPESTESAPPVAGAEQGVVPIVSVTEDVAFYPACGSESVVHDGVTYVQVDGYGRAIDTAALAAVLDVPREPSPLAGSQFGFAVRVAEPGPGDDVGTLVVWQDGVAEFRSDSGDLHRVLVTEGMLDELLGGVPAEPTVC